MRIGEALVEQGALSEEQIDRALHQQKVSGRMLGEVLVDDGVINGSTLVGALARCRDVRGCQLRHGLIDPEFIHEKFIVARSQWAGNTLDTRSIDLNEIGVVGGQHRAKHDGVNRLLRESLPAG